MWRASAARSFPLIGTPSAVPTRWAICDSSHIRSLTGTATTSSQSARSPSVDTIRSAIASCCPVRVATPLSRASTPSSRLSARGSAVAPGGHGLTVSVCRRPSRLPIAAASSLPRFVCISSARISKGCTVSDRTSGARDGRASPGESSQAERSVAATIASNAVFCARRTSGGACRASISDGAEGAATTDSRGDGR